MKNGIIVFALVAFAIAAKAQTKPSLKDLLYGGKLKSDTGTVIRKSDDLSTKIDTTTKKIAPAPMPKSTIATTDLNAITTRDTALSEPVVKESTAAPKSTNKIWKEYTDSLAGALKSEVLSSKKIKKETYYLTVDYELGADGVVSVSNVTCDPENAILQGQVKDRITSAPPQLAAVVDSTGKARKVKKRFAFNITKE